MKKEHFTIMSLCRDNLKDIGVNNSQLVSGATMERIVRNMQDEYHYHHLHEEQFIEILEKSVDSLGIERENI